MSGGSFAVALGTHSPDVALVQAGATVGDRDDVVDLSGPLATEDTSGVSCQVVGAEPRPVASVGGVPDGLAPRAQPIARDGRTPRRTARVIRAIHGRPPTDAKRGELVPHHFHTTTKSKEVGSSPHTSATTRQGLRSTPSLIRILPQSGKARNYAVMYLFG